MFKSFGIVCAVVVALIGTPGPASADWLLTGYVSPLFNVKTSETTFADFNFTLPPEKFDNSVGVGVNLASAFPTRGNLGFEVDFGWYPEALRNSDVLDTILASRLMSISTNFFYSPAIPRVRPYFSVGPNFGYRSDHADAEFETPSGWAVGINGGGGIIAFVNQRFGGRIDVRYFRNFGEFYDLRPDASIRQSGWNDLQFIRVFFGATVVLN